MPGESWTANPIADLIVRNARVSVAGSAERGDGAVRDMKAARVVRFEKIVRVLPERFVGNVPGVTRPADL